MCRFETQTHHELSEDIQKVMRHREPSQILMEKDTCQCHLSISPCQYESTCSFTLQPLLNRKDVHYALAHHVKNDLANLSHKHFQSLVQFTGINSIYHSTPVPMLWQEPDACCHVLLFSLESNSEFNSCLPVRCRSLFAVVNEL